MPFLFEFYLNKTKLSGVEIGFSHSRKWEEALDEAKMSLPFYTSEEPLSQYGLMEITIQEVDNYTDLNEVTSETLNMLVISDEVSLTSQYGIYRHDITMIEYTGKMDAYVMASLARTRDIEINIPAKFELTDNAIDFTEITQQNSRVNFNLYSVFQLPSFMPQQTYFVNKEYTFEQIAQTKLLVEPDTSFSYFGEIVEVPTIFRIYNETTGLYSSWHDISASDITISFTTIGNYQIEYGFQATQQFKVDTTLISQYYPAGNYPIFRFFIKTFDEYQQTVWNALMSVRQNVSKAGGIESEYYFNDTRIFDIDSTQETYLKSIPIPQMYLEQATARQMLIFIFSYINAVPRLEYGEDLDNLTFESFNLSTGSYTEQDIVEKSGSQNINQIGTRSYSPLNQVLPNNMDEPTTYSPSQDGFEQVRADNLQITDASFSIKLQKEIYTPKEFSVYVPSIIITGIDGSTNLDTYTISDDELSIMARTINIEEWKLKNVTLNFPTIVSYDIWNGQLGLRQNMVENLYWELGSNKINLSDVYGDFINRTLYQNVILLSLYERLMLNMPDVIETTLLGTRVGYYEMNYNIGSLSFLEDTEDYKDLRFRFAYLTIENLVTKQDKEDLTQIDFYSEMRQNQDESIINVVRSSRKNHGNLQRTGNKRYSFEKIHYSLSEQYQVGQKDVNDFTITQVDREFYARYFIAEYFITKHHNRESRFQAIDQTYRWRDNYAKNVFNRHENYNDYLMIYPPYISIPERQRTKIYSDLITVKKMLGLILGETITDFKTRATVALIRTDGMFGIEEETDYSKYSLMTEVSAYPIKQGVAFTFGFDGNLVAGDGLVQRGDAGNWYNQAVRYTDEQGRFTRLGFTIYPTYQLDDDDYETYPKITKVSFEDLYYNVYPYFYCGDLSNNSAGDDALVIDKDPLTNINITYQVNVLSYYTNLYIIGQKFFTDNFIVNNPTEQMPSYLYLYDDNTKYEMFDDLFVKDTYSSYVQLTPSNIEYDAVTRRVRFIGISLTNITTWAIGNADGDLYIACNGNHNGFNIFPEHYRLNVKEIGDKLIYYENPLDEDETSQDYNTTVLFEDELVANYLWTQFVNKVTTVLFEDELESTFTFDKYLYVTYLTTFEMADELVSEFDFSQYLYTKHSTTSNFEDELLSTFGFNKVELDWQITNVTEYNSASSKSTQYEDTTTYTLPDANTYSLDYVLRVIVYNLQASNSTEYSASGTQIDIVVTGAETVTQASNPETTVESAVETYDSVTWASFIAGTLSPSAVIRITDQSFNVSYWKTDYVYDYYKAIYVLI